MFAIVAPDRHHLRALLLDAIQQTRRTRHTSCMPVVILFDPKKTR